MYNKVPQRVQAIAYVAKVFYFALHFIAISMLVYYKSPVQDALLQLNVVSTLYLIFQLVISSYLFLVCGKVTGSRSHYPGPLDKQNELELDQLSNEDEKDSNQSHISNEIQLDCKTNFGSNSKLTKQIPEKRFCKDCLNVQPFRTKHCWQCQRCIPKYDHHCFWIGGCVGELNHRLFWGFLASQSLVNLTGLKNFYYALDNYYSLNVQTGEETFESPYYILFLMSFVSFCFLLFTGILGLYHTMLILHGQTTWEQTKRDSITYLKMYPKYYNPFHYGMKRNIELTFNHQDKLIEWELPTYQEAIILSKKQFNYFENEYYSCC